MAVELERLLKNAMIYMFLKKSSLLFKKSSAKHSLGFAQLYLDRPQNFWNNEDTLYQLPSTVEMGTSKSLT